MYLDKINVDPMVLYFPKRLKSKVDAALGPCVGDMRTRAEDLLHDFDFYSMLHWFDRPRPSFYDILEQQVVQVQWAMEEVVPRLIWVECCEILTDKGLRLIYLWKGFLRRLHRRSVQLAQEVLEIWGENLTLRVGRQRDGKREIEFRSDHQRKRYAIEIFLNSETLPRLLNRKFLRRIVELSNPHNPKRISDSRELFVQSFLTADKGPRPCTRQRLLNFYRDYVEKPRSVTGLTFHFSPSPYRLNYVTWTQDAVLRRLLRLHALAWLVQQVFFDIHILLGELQKLCLNPRYKRKTSLKFDLRFTLSDFPEILQAPEKLHDLLDNSPKEFFTKKLSRPKIRSLAAYFEGMTAQRIAIDLVDNPPHPYRFIDRPISGEPGILSLISKSSVKPLYLSPEIVVLPESDFIKGVRMIFYSTESFGVHTASIFSAENFRHYQKIFEETLMKILKEKISGNPLLQDLVNTFFQPEPSNLSACWKTDNLLEVIHTLRLDPYRFSVLDPSLEKALRLVPVAATNLDIPGIKDWITNNYRRYAQVYRIPDEPWLRKNKPQVQACGILYHAELSNNNMLHWKTNPWEVSGLRADVVTHLRKIFESLCATTIKNFNALTQCMQKLASVNFVLQIDFSSFEELFQDRDTFLDYQRRIP